MPVEITIPSISPSISEVNLTQWLVSEETAISKGQSIVEFETDKATVEVESPDDGVLGQIVIPQGTNDVAIGTIIGWLLQEGETCADIPSGSINKPAAINCTPAAKTIVTPTQAAVSTMSTPITTKQTSNRIIASPSARKLARELDISLDGIHGSGPRGRIVKLDIERRANQGITSVSPAADYNAQSDAAPCKSVPLTSMRKVIAKRLTEAKQSVPHFYLAIDCDMEALAVLRQAMNASGERKLSINDFVVRAAALALIANPSVNASWKGDAIHLYPHADVAIAVSTDEGLITPVVRAAESKTLTAITTEVRSLAEKARNGKLLPHDYQGGSFSISNLGMYGISEFNAIVNPPQAAILAVGAVEAKPIVRNGELAVGQQMRCTLSVDHRVVDGAQGAEFLASFKALIENPMSLIQ